MQTNTWLETTAANNKYRRRFRYFEFHADGSIFHRRVTRSWWKPIEKLGQATQKLMVKLENTPARKFYPYGRADFHPLYWWIRRNLTFD